MRISTIAAAALFAASLGASQAAAQDFDPMQYADANKDGKVDMTEATAFSEQGWGFIDQGGAGKVKKDGLDPMFAGSFQGAAVDSDGYVTKAAFMAAVPARFKKADANGDGFLDAKEIRTFLGMPAAG